MKLSISQYTVIQLVGSSIFSQFQFTFLGCAGSTAPARFETQFWSSAAQIRRSSAQHSDVVKRAVALCRSPQMDQVSEQPSCDSFFFPVTTQSWSLYVTKSPRYVVIKDTGFASETADFPGSQAAIRLCIGCHGYFWQVAVSITHWLPFMICFLCISAILCNNVEQRSSSAGSPPKLLYFDKRIQMSLTTEQRVTKA